MYNFIKRIFDITSAALVLVILSPFLVIISLWIILDSNGSAFYEHVRIGK